ncbi:MAG: restriction endonuclease subunit S [Bacteroidia bacterium]|nr:restriction endonuclease subunit S [Bacteroidia bacterium]
MKQLTNMLKNWKTYKLYEIINLIGGGTPKTTNPEYWGGNIPWLSVVDFGKNNKYVYETEKTITPKGLNESSTKILKKGDIIISARGTVGELAVLNKDMAFNQSCYGIASNQKATNEYLYYLLKDSVQRIKQNTHGAVFDTITKQTFENIEVQIPENLKVQSRIASILSSLDDKIELNLQMNKTLEEMAQAIFKEWFVEFKVPGFNGKLIDSTLGKIPYNWEVSSIGESNEVTDFVANGSFAALAENVKYMSEPGYAALIRLTDYHRNFAGDFVYVNEKAYLFLSKSKLVGGEIIIANVGANAGEVFKVPELQIPMTLGPNAIMIKVNEMSNYLYLFLISSIGQHLIKGIIAGSAQPKFNKTDFRRINIIVPHSEVLSEFNKIYKSLFDRILINRAENLTLTQLRDTLLPQLMSGKIEI